ncbi:hypothetical protein TVAG_260270 [Trichomonas vaginalis G3]|uniref:Uncharacterized protein n=1 Tax=Trichomonas vaginalis (strain ATCC PRA-98 / G3) TaxID=412133 RepID=A2E8V9_TRIV3|nr:alpha- and gamma-adaptin-binding protein p34 family [Trichomonas vaginalis G3]EAY10941.1 hypothetical protein TVAG_260270 [Trichomonas vaginalis G3]KAI5485520.1 alpha- and gamma-adaptin-binding protein p34 family [Trichomonas vaginalis G3]|eukprot:XP_001323164.1 hypothetical protein [Trichomonas vaginalis G3]
MSNKLCIIPIGDYAPMQDFITAITTDGETIPIKNKYFECEIKVDMNYKNKPVAVIWVGFARFVDMMPPNAEKFQDCELRLILRVLEDGDQEEVPAKISDWEVESMAEVINIRMSTIEEELKNFRSGKARSSLLDEEQQPAGTRIMESLELVDWPIKMSAGKPRMEQRIEQMVALLKSNDPECENFDQALSIMMELKDQIPKLPDAERHKYAAAVALAFGEMLGVGDEEEEQAEEGAAAQEPNQ